MIAPEELEVAVRVPDRRAELGRRGLRALLRILVAEAEREWGPDWRARLSDGSLGEPGR